VAKQGFLLPKWVCFVGLLAGFLTSSWIEAKTIILSDFDDSIVEGRPHRDGLFHSNFILYRIDVRANTLQEIQSTPYEVLVTGAELFEIKNMLGRGNGRLGMLNTKVRLRTGVEIIPGNYYLRTPESYRYHRSGEGVNYLLEDFKAAEASEAAGVRGTWKGQYWDSMVELLKDPETASSFGILTSRGQEPKDWKEFFNYLRERGYIENLPNLDMVHNVSLHRYDALSLSQDVVEQKVRIVEKTAKALSRVPMDRTRKVLHPNGFEMTDDFHTIVITENDPHAVDKLYDRLKLIAQSKIFPVKFVLVNLGTPEEIIQSGRPANLVIRPDGGMRPAREEELTGELFASAKVYLTGDCPILKDLANAR